MPKDFYPNIHLLTWMYWGLAPSQKTKPLTLQLVDSRHQLLGHNPHELTKRRSRASNNLGEVSMNKHNDSITQ